MGSGRWRKNWNSYLSDGCNEGYIEIQAGLARTQLEHLPMADGETWSWVEAYGALNGGETMHGNIQTAVSAVQQSLKQNFADGVDVTLSKLLKKSLENPENHHWYAFMHLGVMEYAVGNVKASQVAFECSVALTENAWSYRNLAMLYRNEYCNLHTGRSICRMATGLQPNWSTAK